MGKLRHSAAEPLAPSGQTEAGLEAQSVLGSSCCTALSYPLMYRGSWVPSLGMPHPCQVEQACEGIPLTRDCACINPPACWEQFAAKDFVGWTGLAPISILYEYVMGIKGDPVHNKICWNVNLTEAHGIVDYPFGDQAVTLRCESRSDVTEEPMITAECGIPLELEVHWGNSKTKTLRFNM